VWLPLLLCGLTRCGSDPCRLSPVELPSEVQALPWVTQTNFAVLATAESHGWVAVLDSAFPQTSIAAADAARFNLDLSNLVIQLGGVHAGPLAARPIFSESSVIGTDVLASVPFLANPRGRTFEFFPSFQPAQPGDVSIQQQSGDSCAEGPLFLVEASVEGTPVKLVLDTGADVSVLRRSVWDTLTGRPTLDGIRVVTGYGGATNFSARRATLSVGGAQVAGLPLLAAAAADVELERLSADGFLGWTFLREFVVGLQAKDVQTRLLRLTRLEAQTHWTRDYVGIGVNLSPANGALRVDGFLSQSPAKEAGVLQGDLIVGVNGLPVSEAPSPFAPAGQSVTLSLERDGAQFELQVVSRDLLP